jgi:8-oxo-dGTP pyrophosphatase MutT (NUDIX family)
MQQATAAAAIRDREALRSRLRAAGGELDRDGWLRGDEGHERAPGERRPAAVLLGLVDRPGGPHIILTQRTAHLRDHAGQISLPGGRMEPDDAGPAEAALREALEEIGLEPGKVELLGGLRHYDTVTGFRIHPVVGWIEPPVALTPDPYEVEEVFELPLNFALDPANHRRDSYDRNGVKRHFYVLPYQHRYIWGATAGILVNFARLLAD